MVESILDEGTVAVGTGMDFWESLRRSKMPAERDNARNNARCTQARKTTHGLDGQHQYVDTTLRGRVNQNDRGQS